MNIVLAPDGPLHAGATLARYRLWGEDPANRLADGALLRVLRRHGRLVPYEVRPTGSVDDARLMVRIARARDAATGEAVAAEARQIFGLAFDLSGFYRMAKGDPVLAALVEPLYGMRPTLAPTPLEMLVGSISAQQVNLQFAFACRARLVRRYGMPVALGRHTDRKSTRLNSSHGYISYAVLCLKKTFSLSSKSIPLQSVPECLRLRPSCRPCSAPLTP